MKNLEETKINLEQNYIDIINKIIYDHIEYFGCEIYIYGSRARNDKNSERSDIDIAIKVQNNQKLTMQEKNQLLRELNAYILSYSKDITDINGLEEGIFKENLLNDAVRIDIFKIVKYCKNNEYKLEFEKQIKVIKECLEEIKKFKISINQNNGTNFKPEFLYIIEMIKLIEQNIKTLIFAIKNNCINLMYSLIRMQSEIPIKIIKHYKKLNDSNEVIDFMITEKIITQEDRDELKKIKDETQDYIHCDYAIKVQKDINNKANNFSFSDVYYDSHGINVDNDKFDIEHLNLIYEKFFTTIIKFNIFTLISLKVIRYIK